MSVDTSSAQVPPRAASNGSTPIQIRIVDGVAEEGPPHLATANQQPVDLSSSTARLIQSIGNSIVSMGQIHFTARSAESNFEAVVALVHSSIAATVLLCVCACQLLSVALSVDSILVRMGSGLENMFSDVAHQLRQGISWTTFWPSYFKSLIKMVWLIMAFKIKFSMIRPVFLDLTTIRVLIEWITFAIDHRDDYIAPLASNRLAALRLVVSHVVGFGAISLLYQSFFHYSVAHFTSLEHYVILLVWLGEPIGNLLGSIILMAKSISSESLLGSITLLRVEIVLSMFHYIMAVIMYFTGYLSSSYWSHCLLFHYTIPIVVQCSRLIQLHAIQWQMQTRFKQLTKEEVESLQSDESCPICLQEHEYPSTVKLSCGHLAHSVCLVNMLKASAEPKCPLCRASIPIIFDELGGIQYSENVNYSAVGSTATAGAHSTHTAHSNLSTSQHPSPQTPLMGRINRIEISTENFDSDRFGDPIISRYLSITPQSTLFRLANTNRTTHSPTRHSRVSFSPRIGSRDETARHIGNSGPINITISPLRHDLPTARLSTAEDFSSPFVPLSVDTTPSAAAITNPSNVHGINTDDHSVLENNSTIVQDIVPMVIATPARSHTRRTTRSMTKASAKRTVTQEMETNISLSAKRPNKRSRL